MYRLRAEFPRDIDPIFYGNQLHLFISLCIENVKKPEIPVRLYSNPYKKQKATSKKDTRELD